MPEPKKNASKKFLLIEDNENIRKLYKILIGQKYNATVASFAENGKEGLEACKKTEPDLILCDIKMPLMNGIEFHKHLKETSPHLANRVAFISAGFSNSHLNYIRENNCKYLEKPFEIEAFHEFINSMLMANRENARTTHNVLQIFSSPLAEEGEER